MKDPRCRAKGKGRAKICVLHYLEPIFLKFMLHVSFGGGHIIYNGKIMILFHFYVFFPKTLYQPSESHNWCSFVQSHHMLLVLQYERGLFYCWKVRIFFTGLSCQQHISYRNSLNILRRASYVINEFRCRSSPFIHS